MRDQNKRVFRAKTASRELLTIEDPANPRPLSPVSLQEIAIKVQLGKLRLVFYTIVVSLGI
jgi:PIN domain nuclease of toxin-antitoxin system